MTELASAPGTPGRPIRSIDGGLVAYNEEESVEPAIRSLLGQELPSGIAWGTIWVVTSGCTDRTEMRVAALAAQDPRVRLVHEEQRRGKSRALVEVFERARGDALVLLNSDAVAEPGAVAALLREAEGAPRPFGVMGHPSVARRAGSRLDRAVDLLWAIHHEFHVELQDEGGGTHLSDELLLLSLPAPPVMREGIINDGAYLAAWLSLNGGSRRYAVDARVRIDVPRGLRDHLRQRRRIHVGDRQVAASLGVRPSTFTTLARRSPGRALSIARRSMHTTSRGVVDLLGLTAGELVAGAMAAWDWRVPGKDHVRWDRISRPVVEPGPPPVPGSPSPARPVDLGPASERRLRSLLEVARQFRTGIALEELGYLLPPGGPSTPDELQRSLADRPDLARVEGGRAFSPQARGERLDERRARAERYRAAARGLVDRDLAPVRPWLCCLGITGSTAYGEPEDGDDLDLFVVARRGTLWLLLAYTYLAVRLRFRPGGPHDRPAPCLNRVLDEPTARREFRERRGFLFAREALTARMLVGEDYYRRLLYSGPSLEAELPRLYRREALAGPLPTIPAASLPTRALNAVVFPGMAAYLQAVGLWRNAGFRRDGCRSAEFRTRTLPGKLAFESVRFDRLAGAAGSPIGNEGPVGIATAPRPMSYR